MLLAQASRFAVVGAINTAVDLSLFAFLFYILRWPLLVANAGGFLVAVLVSYMLNKTWTFADTSRGTESLRRGVAFLGVATIGLGVGSAVIWVAALFVAPILAKLAATGATFLWNFTASRRWVFRPA
jgi:putative flippase GtrA